MNSTELHESFIFHMKTLYYHEPMWTNIDAMILIENEATYLPKVNFSLHSMCLTCPSSKQCLYGFHLNQLKSRQVDNARTGIIEIKLIQIQQMKESREKCIFKNQLKLYIHNKPCYSIIIQITIKIRNCQFHP